MKISYRYLPLDVALSEVASVRRGDINIVASIGKEDYHLRPFTDQGISEERIFEIRLNFFSLLGVDSNRVRDISLSKSQFDTIFTKNALSMLHDLNPVDGFSKDVWSYLTLRVLPDFALWRWPDIKTPEERYLGGVERSCFQRLWQRAYILGGDLASELLEDEALNIFERTQALGSNRRLSKVFAEYVVKNRGRFDAKSGERFINTEIVKQTAQRLRRTMSVQVVQTMSDKELETYVSSSFIETFEFKIKK